MQLRVLSYNIHRAIGIDRLFRPARIAKVLRHHEADLVLLQEVDVGVPRSGMLDLADEMSNAAGYPYHAIGLNVELSEGSYGNATLSRWPIIRQRNIDLTVGDRKCRGCLYTRVALDAGDEPERQIDIFNMHLGLTSQERVRQVGTLIHAPEFAALRATDRPCLVGGDFNDWGTLLAPIFTDILDFECATNHSGGYHKPYHTYPSFSPAGGLDKIFFRGPLQLVRRRRCWMGLTRIASDHLPVIADFEY
ncbi:MAG: endonuclease [Deltaproteobacteria bacterium RIFOXYD12_FULL_57_12]|nr:MAG: endonuclease [Deltaproteobacteria bacterium RIFOXYD12_FULL_57_12]